MMPPMPIPIIDRNPLAAAACGPYGVVRHSPRHPAVHPRPRGRRPRAVGRISACRNTPNQGCSDTQSRPRRKASQAGGLVGVLWSTRPPCLAEEIQPPERLGTP